MSGHPVSFASSTIASAYSTDEEDEYLSSERGAVIPPGTPIVSRVPSTGLAAVRVSEGGGRSSSTQRAGGSFKSKSLRSNLMREQVNRDPLFFYEVVKVLGVGSMGSVSMVSKRASVVGGSARKKVQEHFRREKQMDDCFALPIVGGFFNYCLRGWRRENLDTDDDPEETIDENSAPPTSPPRKTKEVIVYAMKSIHLSRVTDPNFVDELKNEISVLRSLDHPHIVRPMETFEHRNQIFIVMELCSGGDLYTRDPYTEAEAARIVGSILSAISYMHSRNVCHRDIKYENILFMNDSPRAEVKLIDFGLSAKFGQEKLTEGVGTIYTMAPEVIKGSYSKAADLWSVGVIAYMLCSSQMPFYGRKRQHIVESIMNGSFHFKGRRWKRASDQSKAFIEDLLVVDPDDRATADEALAASWLNRRFTATVRNPHVKEVESAQASLAKYAQYSKLKKVALMVVAHRSSSQEIGILRKVFQKYDRKGCGTLSYENFSLAIADAGYTEADVRDIFDAVDLDGSGKIRYTEFLAATIEAQGAISEERLAEAFDRIDSDDSGYISAKNLRDMLGHEFPPDEIEDIIREADLTNDGKISYAEFLALWEDQNEAKREQAMNEIYVNAPLGSVGSMESVDSQSQDLKEKIEGEVVPRANFLEGKQLSERRESEGKKAVNFQASIIHIPEAS